VIMRKARIDRRSRQGREDVFVVGKQFIVEE
jgi:hypothetical protein